MRGETIFTNQISSDRSGLSPRARGNREFPSLDKAEKGSIPTCAGKPVEELLAVDAQEVYPHVRGETPATGGRASEDSGSIPTCAGKPVRARSSMIKARVYPHVRGETNMAPTPLRRRLGLSPRARGNLPFHIEDADLGGSIPTCAGKPACCICRRSGAGVYPHVRGETTAGPGPSAPAPGLSPRARGNL